MRSMPVSFESFAPFLRRHLSFLVGLTALGVGLYLAVSEGDEQSRRALQYANSVRMTCEDDPESTLWNGGCDRIAADIARKDRPAFLELYQAFAIVHHSGAPATAAGRVADAPDEKFAIGAALGGTRYLISRREFADVVNAAQARAIMDEIDKRDRALLTIERDGRLSVRALMAATLANLTSTAALLAAVAVGLMLWLLHRRQD